MILEIKNTNPTRVRDLKDGFYKTTEVLWFKTVDGLYSVTLSGLQTKYEPEFELKFFSNIKPTNVRIEIF